MDIIMAVVSAFVTLVGLLTLGSSSESAACERDYEPLRLSTIMIIVGVFCFTFFLFGFTKAIAAAVISAIIIFIVHTVVSYTCAGAYKFENSRLNRIDLPDIVAPEERESIVSEELAAE